MGKRSKSMKRKSQINKQVAVNEEIKQDSIMLTDEVITLQKVAKNAKENGKYNDALQALVELLQINYVTIEVLYEIAEIYYLTGDYNRTIMWIQNVLNKNAAYKAALLLSIKVEILRDKMEDALSSLNKLILLQKENFEDEYEEKIQDIFKFSFLELDERVLQAKYPVIWEYINKETINRQISNEDNIEVFKDTIEEENDEIKKSMCSSKNQKTLDIEVVQKSVMEKNISLMDKVTLCHTLAQDYFLEGNLKLSLGMLNLAMAIDNKNDLTIKNLGSVFIEMGDTDSALACFKKVKEKDIMVAKIMRDLQQ